MVTTRSSVPIRTHRNALSPALLATAVLWFVTAIASRLFSDGADWEGPYGRFSMSLMIAAATSAGAIIVYTSKPKSWSLARVAAAALMILAVASTIVAWAFVMWSVLLAAGFASLAATGPRQRRDARWLSIALLSGLAVALVGLWAKIGPPGKYNDYSQAQDWGTTVSCALASAVLGVLAWRHQRERAVAGSAQPT